MTRALWILAGADGFLAVALGAFGAHGLKAWLSTLADGSARLEWWDTAARYQLVHALAIGLAAVLSEHRSHRLPLAAGLAFAIGTLLFSGSLDLMALTGNRALGVITPVGGLGLLTGWALVGVAGARK